MPGPICASDLVMVFLVRDHRDHRPSSLPTLGVKDIRHAAHGLARCGINAVKIFASDPQRDARASGGTRSDSLMIQAIEEVKVAEPGLVVIPETCLCSYTDTSDCHLTGPAGVPDLPATIEALTAQALVQAAAGADTVGPVAMIGGAVRSIRGALDTSGYSRVGIMPHLIFASGLYSGYRSAMDAASPSGIREFQVRPGHPQQAVQAGLDFLSEGANALLLEPALFCADVLADLRRATTAPILPFSVSGEYTMLNQPLLIELFTMLKRTGCDQIITYAADTIAETLALSTLPNDLLV
jgi:porphobilinogen synthase